MSNFVQPTRVEAYIDFFVDDLPSRMIDNMLEALKDEAKMEVNRSGDYITVTSTVQIPVDEIVLDLLEEDDLTRTLEEYHLRPQVTGKDSERIDVVYS